MESVKVHRCRFVDVPPQAITATSFSPSNSCLAIAYDNGDIELKHVESLNTFTTVARIPGRKDEPIRTMAWICEAVEVNKHHEQGNQVALRERLFFGGLNGIIYEADFTTCSRVKAIDSSGGAIWSLAASSNAQMLAAACDDGLVRLFELASDQVLTVKQADARKAALVPYKSTPTELVSSEVNISETTHLEFSRSLSGLNGRCMSVAWHPTQRILFGGSSEGVIIGWDLRSDSPAFGRSAIQMDLQSTVNESRKSRHLKDIQATIIWSLVVLDDFTVYSGDSLGHINVWDGRSGSLLHTFRHHDADILSLAIAARIPEYWSNTSNDNNTAVSETASLAPLCTTCRCVAASVDGRVSVMKGVDLSLSNSSGDMISVQQIKWIMESQHRSHTHDVRAVTAGVCPTILSSASEQGLVDMPLDANKHRRKRKRHSQAMDMRKLIASKAESDLLATIVSGGDDCKLCVTDVVSMNRNRPPTVLPPSIASECFSVGKQEGKHGHPLLLVRNENMIELWKLAQSAPAPGSAVKQFTLRFGEASNLRAGNISADCKYICVVNDQGLRLFGITTQDNGTASGLEEINVKGGHNSDLQWIKKPKKSRLYSSDEPATDAAVSVAFASIGQRSVLLVLTAGGSLCTFEIGTQESTLQNGDLIKTRTHSIDSDSSVSDDSSDEEIEDSKCVASLKAVMQAPRSNMAQQTHGNFKRNKNSTLHSNNSTSEPNEKASNTSLSIAPLSLFAIGSCHLKVSSDGHWAAAADTSGHVHIFDLKKACHHVTLPAIEAMKRPASLTFFRENDHTYLAAVGSSLKLYTFDIANGILSDWSKQYADKLPGYYLQKAVKGLSIHSILGYSSLNNAANEKLVLSTRDFLCHVDPSLAPDTPWDKDDTTTKSRGTHIHGKHMLSQNFRICEDFVDVCFASSIPTSPAELVVVELDGRKMLRRLPDPVAVVRYGA